jgi:hypothetical protein
VPRKKTTWSLNAPAFHGDKDSRSAYANIADTNARDPLSLLIEAEEEARSVESDSVTRQACELAGIEFESFKTMSDRGLLLRDRITRFTCTRDAGQFNPEGKTRQAVSKKLRELLPKARLVVPLQAILSNNFEAFRKWFPNLIVGWKGGLVEKFVQLQPAVARRGKMLGEQFAQAASALLGDSLQQLHDSSRYLWDGTVAEEFPRFLELYNRLRVSAVFAPNDTYSVASNVRPNVTPKQFWLIRAVERALHLTGKLETSRRWIEDIATLLDFESQVPANSLAFSAYVGVYYADCLSVSEWTSITQPVGLSSPWLPTTVSRVLDETYQNTREEWYQTPEQNTVNLLRCALYLRCHPDQPILSSRDKRMVQMIVSCANKRNVLPAGRNAIILMQGLSR